MALLRRDVGTEGETAFTGIAPVPVLEAIGSCTSLEDLSPSKMYKK